MAKVHAYIISHLRDQFGWFGKDSKKKELLDGLGEEFKKVQHRNNLPMGDFPNLTRFREKLVLYDIHKFPKLELKKVEAMEQVLAKDIPELTRYARDVRDLLELKAKRSGVPNGMEEVNPFDIKEQPTGAWIIDAAVKLKYDNLFHTLNLTDGKVSGANVKKLMLESQIPATTLRAIWTLSDIDKDGYLDADEFAVCMYLIEGIKSNQFESLPDQLPSALVPPSRRQVLSDN